MEVGEGFKPLVLASPLLPRPFLDFLPLSCSKPCVKPWHLPQFQLLPRESCSHSYSVPCPPRWKRSYLFHLQNRRPNLIHFSRLSRFQPIRDMFPDISEHSVSLSFCIPLVFIACMYHSTLSYVPLCVVLIFPLYLTNEPGSSLRTRTVPSTILAHRKIQLNPYALMHLEVNYDLWYKQYTSSHKARHSYKQS